MRPLSRTSRFGTFLALLALAGSVPSLARDSDRGGNSGGNGDGDGWRICAEEGGTCRVQGRAVIRYGADNRWVMRSVVGGVACGNEAFGDPAPEVRKQCEVQGGNNRARRGKNGRSDRGSGESGWTFCAAEGEVCQFRGQADVRFGTRRNFSTRTAYGSVRCDVSDFGDPAFGVTKYCEVRSSAAVAGAGNRPDAWAGWNRGQKAEGWSYCAAEGAVCKVQGRAKVRFGDGRRYNTRTVDGQIDCGIQSFGDPAYNQRKHCEVQGAVDDGSSASAWQPCAEEGARCEFSGRAQVRYGTAGRYVYRDAYGSVLCDSGSFGNDPFVNRVKRCEIRR